MGFLVYVIESPSPADLYVGRSEGHLLSQAVLLNQIPCVARTAVSRAIFMEAISTGFREVMGIYKQLLPVLHISAHGSQEGIHLTDGTYITWENLRLSLMPINRIFESSLLVCLSSCYGFAGTRMAMFLQDTELPFYAIVGCASSPTWSDAAVAYATFYHHLSKGAAFETAVNAMRAASGVSDFYVQEGVQTRQSYIEYIRELDLNHARQQLGQFTSCGTVSV